jgi:hypothetical protein
VFTVDEEEYRAELPPLLLATPHAERSIISSLLGFVIG